MVNTDPVKVSTVVRKEDDVILVVDEKTGLVYSITRIDDRLVLTPVSKFT